MGNIAVLVTGQLALVSAAVFAGAAFYINWAEQPARLQLGDEALLAQWKPSYKAGFGMQASLAVIGFLLALATWMQGAHWLWLLAGCTLVANWPYTLLVIMPVNNRLNALSPTQAGSASRDMIVRWGHLHAVRTALGTLATLLMLSASVSY